MRETKEQYAVKLKEFLQLVGVLPVEAYFGCMQQSVSHYVQISFTLL